MEDKTWQGFIQPAGCHPSDDGLRITFKEGPSALLPASLPDFSYCRDLVIRQQPQGLPIWARGRGSTIEQVRFARVATILQFTPEPLGGAFLLFSDSPNSHYFPDTHPHCERILGVLSTAFRENRPVLYALEEEGLLADAEPLPARTEVNGLIDPAALQQSPL